MSNNILSSLSMVNPHSMAKSFNHIPSAVTMRQDGQVELFRRMVESDSNFVVHQSQAVMAVPKNINIQGDRQIVSMMQKLDHWRNSGNSYLMNIQQNLQQGPLNAMAMMKLQLDLLKFSLGYEMTSKLVGKGIGAIDTLLRSQ